MSIEMSEKFLAVRNALRMTCEEFGEKVNISTSYVSLIEHGTRKPSARIVASLFSALSVSQKWWATGEGAMFADRDAEVQGSLSDMEVTMVNLFRLLDSVQKRAVLGLVAALTENSNIEE